jgi:hypothetical protein
MPFLSQLSFNSLSPSHHQLQKPLLVDPVGPSLADLRSTYHGGEQPGSVPARMPCAGVISRAAFRFLA